MEADRLQSAEPNLDIDLQVGNDVSHVVAQVPEGQVARLLGEIPGPPCLTAHHPPGPLQVHLDTLQPQQVLEDHIVLGQNLQRYVMLVGLKDMLGPAMCL